MAERFQICFMKPPAYDGALVFREVLFLLRNSLRDRGYACDIHPNQLATDAVNIIVGYHLLEFSDQLMQTRYIPYQLEQLDAHAGWYTDNARRILEHADAVWDFSEINIGFLRERSIAAKHLPTGWHRDLEIIPRAAERDIDVLFYGSINERRKQLLEALSEHAKVKVLLGVFGRERDEWIARSKIVLNMHYYPTRILETVRVSYLLNNRAFVICEDSADNPFAGVDLVTAPYERLIDTCREYLARPAAMSERRERNYHEFRELYPMTELLRGVLEG